MSGRQSVGGHCDIGISFEKAKELRGMKGKRKRETLERKKSKRNQRRKARGRRGRSEALISRRRKSRREEGFDTLTPDSRLRHHGTFFTGPAAGRAVIGQQPPPGTISENSSSPAFRGLSRMQLQHTGGCGLYSDAIAMTSC